MKLLFIGNSHTYYNDMPATVMSLLEQTATKAHVTMLTKGGKGLVYHAPTHAAAFNIRYGKYDAVIAQDRAKGFDPALFREGASALKQIADEAGVPLLLYMPWAGRDHREAQSVMTDTYLNFCKENGCALAPAGEVFTRLLTTEPADALYREDGNHATPLGSYAAAVTIFYTVTGRKRVIPVTEKDPGIVLGLSSELCRRIHADACHTVRLYNG